MISKENINACDAKVKDLKRQAAKLRDELAEAEKMLEFAKQNYKDAKRELWGKYCSSKQCITSAWLKSMGACVTSMGVSNQCRFIFNSIYLEFDLDAYLVYHAGDTKKRFCLCAIKYQSELVALLFALKLDEIIDR